MVQAEEELAFQHSNAPAPDNVLTEAKILKAIEDCRKMTVFIVSCPWCNAPPQAHRSDCPLFVKLEEICICGTTQHERPRCTAAVHTTRTLDVDLTSDTPTPDKAFGEPAPRKIAGVTVTIQDGRFVAAVLQPKWAGRVEPRSKDVLHCRIPESVLDEPLSEFVLPGSATVRQLLRAISLFRVRS
jgi:hypothetical protein